MFYSKLLTVRAAIAAALLAALVIVPAGADAASAPLVEVVSLGTPTTPVILIVVKLW